ncbi:MAG TPA: hypothetical protein ENL19_02550 [candidate division WOR-3 bacterium]|uniref:Uncharacterized protein n=1 Tax=candidate division WOR-3 bacterium TaxID=2052148 RepID=A0A7C5DB23_UNCW3|nr:hypothetical protein [candidate division WOR-3 bacterium]
MFSYEYGEWVYPFRSCEFSGPALSQLLDKMCKKGYLQKIEKGKYALSQRYVEEAIRAMDKGILSSYPLKNIYTFNKIPYKDKFPLPVHIYGISKDLIDFLNSKKAYHKKFEKMVKDLHLAAFQIREFKKELALEYIKSKFFKKCEISKEGDFKKALQYAKEHPHGFLSILETMIYGMEFFPDEIDYIQVIILSKIEEDVAQFKKSGKDSRSDWEIDIEDIHKLPEMMVIRIIEEIIKKNMENLYPLLPTIVYAPPSIPKIVWKGMLMTKNL